MVMERKDLYETPLPAEAFEPEEAPDLDVIDRWHDVVLGSDLEPGSAYERTAVWKITDDGAAQWAMAHAAEAKVKLDELELQHAAWREQLAVSVERRRRPLADRLAFFEERLIDYAARQRAADPKAKTLALPSGRVSSRAAKERLVVEDAESFLKWADASERFDLFRIEKKPELTAMKDALLIVNADDGEHGRRVVDPATGEPVPGLSVAEATVTFTVQPS